MQKRYSAERFGNIYKTVPNRINEAEGVSVPFLSIEFEV